MTKYRQETSKLVVVDWGALATWQEWKAKDRSPGNCNSKGQKERQRQEAREATQEETREMGDGGCKEAGGLAVPTVPGGARTGSATGRENIVRCGQQKAPGEVRRVA